MNSVSERDKYIGYIVDTYSDMLVRLAFTYVKSVADAEDIVQDVFVELIKKKIEFKSTEHEKAWLIRVSINKSKNALKTVWRKRSDELNTDIPYFDNRDCEITEIILSLPENYKTAIYLHYICGYSIKEISEITRRNSATVGTWLARGRQLLKSKLIGGLDNEN